MDYPTALNYLFNQLPMFSRIGAAAYKKDLTNIVKLCAHFGNPQQQFKTIHIAGTNGKGSTSHLLAATFQAAGYKTALYTSPHYLDFRERIKVNNKMISPQFVIDFTIKIQELVKEIQPSFFEITVAMAFLYFQQQQVDIAIIETGLGGRLDSTNIINPILSIITNIDYDHQDMLGDTLPKIAFEKAGIIKPNTPVLIGEPTNEINAVFIDKAKLENANLYFAPDLANTQFINQSLEHSHYNCTDLASKQSHFITLQMLGSYQLKNLNTSFAAILLIQKYGNFNINIAHLQTAAAQVQTTTGLYGRWQILQKQPLTIADAAHNPHGIKYATQQLRHTLKTYQLTHLHFIFGCVKDKDISSILALLPKEATYYFCNAQIPRAKPAAALAAEAQQYHLSGEAYPTIAAALAAAKANCQTNQLLFIGGSIFVVGEALAEFTL